MVPLTTFLIIWIILLAIYGLLVLVTLIQMLRHGLPSAAAYVTTFVFLIVSAGVIFGTGWYLTDVDWTVSVNMMPEGILPFFLGGS